MLRSASRATATAGTGAEDMVAKEFVGVRIPKEVRQALEKLAKADDRTVSYIINKILREHLHDKKLLK